MEPSNQIMEFAMALIMQDFAGVQTGLFNIFLLTAVKIV